MKQANWVWMPHVGHFILGHRCRFRLNTYVGGYIVSTVGELWNSQDVRRIRAEIWDITWYEQNKDKMGDEFDDSYMEKFGYEEVGFQAKYETMVFRAGKSDIGCCPYKVLDWDGVDSAVYQTAEKARKGHYRLCKKWSQKPKAKK